MTPDRPSPEPDLASQGFFDGLRARRLMVQRCPHCGALQLSELQCNRCHAEGLEWVPASGRATLYSLVNIHMRYHEGFADQVPYNAATVELAEGPRLYANIVAAGPDPLALGMPLEVDYSELSTGVVVPVFRPAAGVA